VIGHGHIAGSEAETHGRSAHGQVHLMIEIVGCRQSQSAIIKEARAPGV
jgi:hypothetical protein